MYQFLYFPIGKQEFQFTSAKFEIELKKKKEMIKLMYYGKSFENKVSFCKE